ncbi:hypothetical protein HJC23_011392 [Cyclotella cryptica]|uniref:peptidylprolyl isomerase n=1 Tax=Cyclotella cryptica TaxID=29204 RepID=A0ABD3PRR5_9STRA|eukprot:CCRYP_012712-RA/>CCRYP_012712-RA protein AED:0.35 eAED:0.35 QI:0/-1/0/1/-1/1/1/0/528
MKAYLSLSHGNKPLGTLRLTLRPDIVPQTVENFVHFLTCHNKNPPSSPGGYRSSTFHRIIPKFMAQGGDFLHHDGTGSTSLFGPKFPDENFILSHSQRGTLSMANSGADTNGCQFFITFRSTAHLDGKHVVFGYVEWRDDEESSRVLDMLEKVKTDRRNDRPVERVEIVDCGVIEEAKTKKVEGGEEGGEKLVGEAKKNKLLQAYGQVERGGEVDPAADYDEIDIDEDDDHGDRAEERTQATTKESTLGVDSKARDEDEIDIEDEHDQPEDDPNESDPPPTGKVSSKKAALQKRLAALRTKINQSRTLNRREVHAEAKRMGTDEAAAQERRRQNKQDKSTKQKEYETYVVGKLKAVAEADSNMTADEKAEQKRLASLAQPAYESIRKMNAKADKMEISQYGPDDYYNPEGQYSNYARNLKSIRHNNASKRGGAGAAVSSTIDSFDPTLTNHGGNAHDKSSEKDGAKRLADEMKRRAEKRANKRGRPEFDAYDVSYINDRNKRFNEKISRNFDEHTAEIRQNLERGTAL